jgi:hypothetical protein
LEIAACKSLIIDELIIDDVCGPVWLKTAGKAHTLPARWTGMVKGITNLWWLLLITAGVLAR